MDVLQLDGALPDTSSRSISCKSVKELQVSLPTYLIPPPINLTLQTLTK